MTKLDINKFTPEELVKITALLDTIKVLQDALKANYVVLKTNQMKFHLKEIFFFI